MAGLLSKSLWEESETALADAVVKPLADSLTASVNAYQQQAQQAQQAAPSFHLPHPGEIFGGQTEQPDAAQAPAQQPASFSLPHPSDIFGAPAAAAPQTPAYQTGRASSPPAQVGIPQAASGTPSAMPTSSSYGPAEGAGSGTIQGTSRPERINSARQFADAAEQRTGVPADVNLAFAVHESGLEDQYGPGMSYHGRHAVEGEDGTPITDWGYDAQGNRVDYPTKLKSYQNASGSFDDFADLIAGSSRYQPALQRYKQSGDRDQLIRDIWSAGYGESKSGPDETVNIRQNQTAGGQSVTPNAPATAASSPPQSSAGAPPTAGASWEVDQAALDDADKWALCGPVAAVMAATKRGGQWTVAQAKQIAQGSNLWDAGQGMHGLGTEVDLLNRMGVSARTGAADEQSLAADAQAGNTPIISTNKHYFILKGYDPSTGKFDTTTSGGVLKGGSRYLTLAEISNLGGGIQGAAYMDNPASPTPSSVAAGDSQKTGVDANVDASGMSAGDQKRAKLAAARGDQPADDPTQDTDGPNRGRIIYQDPDNPQAMPGSVYRNGVGPEGLPGYGDPNPGYRGYNPRGDQIPPAGYPYLDYPIDDRAPGEQPYDVTDADGIDRSGDSITQNPGRIRHQDGVTPYGAAPDAMYRQPLTPTMGDTATGQEYDPRDADQGPHEMTQNGSPWVTVGQDGSPGATYGAAQDDPGQAPAYQPPPYQVVGSDQPLPSDAANEIELPIAARPSQRYQFQPAGTPLGSDASQTVEMPVKGRPTYQTVASDAPLDSDAGAMTEMQTRPRELITAQDDTQPQIVQQGMPTPDLVPVWNAARQVIGYVHHGAEQIKDGASSLVEGAKGVASTVDSYLPSPAGGLPEIGARIRQIQDQAAADQGKSGDVRAMFTAADDPQWRAANPDLAQEYDDLQGQYTLSVGGNVGAGGDQPFIRAKQTVEKLQQRLTQARNIVDRLIHSGDPERLALAQENAAGIESDLIDAVNKRRGLEPRIKSDVGTKETDLPLSEGRSDVLNEAMRPQEGARTAPEDLSGPVSIPTDTGSRLNAGVGVSGRPGILPTLANAAQGGVLGAASEDLQAEQEGRDPDPTQRLLRAAGGAGLAVLAGRAMRGGEGRRLGSGVVPTGPNRLGNVPPSQTNQGNLPGMHPLQQPQPTPIGQVAQQFAITGLTPGQNAGVQRTLSAAQQRASNMASRGLATPSPWEWIKAAGYSGIYSPATAVSSAIGGAQELLLAQPKEAIRALVEGRPVVTGAQARRQVGAATEGIVNLGRVLMGDAGGSAAASGGSRGTAGLSERVVNPAGHGVARILEKPGEVLTEAPDAVFRPQFRAQGEAREASRVASEMGLPRSQRGAYAEQLMQDAEAVRGGQLPSLPETQRVVDAGSKYADDLGFKGKPGAFGQWLAKVSKRDDAIGVAASFLMPFPSMASRMTGAAVKSTPGAALIPGVRKMYPSKFDMVYDQAFGTVAATGVAYWAMNGGITGSGPSDGAERAQMVAQGWQPNSVLVGGHYIPNRMMGRFQAFLDTAGELHDALAYGKSDRTAPQVASELVKRGSKIATDQVGLSGLADLHDMLESGFSSQFPGWAARSLTRYAPYGGVLRSVAASLDPNQRRAEPWREGSPLPAIGEQMKTAVPGLRQSVPAAQDVLGRPMDNPQQGLGAFIPRTTTLRNDPVIRLFQDANVDIGRAHDQMTVGRVAGVALKPAEQRRWNEIRGQFVQDYSDAYTSNAEFMALPPAQKEKYLKTFLGKAADYADKMVMSEMDAGDLTTRATDQAMKKAVGQ